MVASTDGRDRDLVARRSEENQVGRGRVRALEGILSLRRDWRMGLSV